MRIAIIGGRGYDSSYGGVENAVSEISRRLSQRSDLEVEVYGHGDNRFFDVRQTDGVIVVSAPAWVSKLGHSAVGFFCFFFALLQRRPDVLLLFAAGPCLLSVLARPLGIRTIACLRGVDSIKEKHGPISRLILRAGERAALNVADICTVNSLDLLARFAGQGKLEPVFVPNGASDSLAGEESVLDEFNLQKDNYILFAARLDPVKQLDTLLKGYGLTSKKFRMPLVVAGGQCTDPAYQERLSALADDGVQFVGHLAKKRLDPLMRNAAIFVLPSAIEGMSNSLLAAMKAERCVICSDIPANADVVEYDPEVIFPLGDEHALGARLQYFMRETEARQNCGKKMLEIVNRRFTWKATAKQFAMIIEDVSKKRLCGVK